MPSPGASVAPRLPMEDAYFELLADTLESMDIPARSQFLQRFLRATTQLELRETQCVQIWEEMLTRRRELSEHLHRPVSFATCIDGRSRCRWPHSRSGSDGIWSIQEAASQCGH